MTNNYYYATDFTHNCLLIVRVFDKLCDQINSFNIKCLRNYLSSECESIINSRYMTYLMDISK